jgi:hypothetical protein
MPLRLKQNSPGRTSGDFNKHTLEKIVAVGQGKKYPARQCNVCAAHKKLSEMSYICEFWYVPMHNGSCFERFHSKKHY